MKYRARIQVTLKPSVNDPQGSAVLGGLRTLGFDSVENVRIGKFMTLELEADEERAALQHVQQMCDGLLSNPVIETYEIQLESALDP